ncbi:MAG: preprotein translocase subunit SecE [Ndongobacter sp.]|nr:preprotein translocase subunit SecE [Ndongobacter sp.]
MTEKKKGGFLKSVRSELKKIVWPTKANTLQYTVTVIIIAVLIALFCWVLDIVFGSLVGLLA